MSQARRWALTEVLRRGLNLTSFLLVARFLTVEEFATFVLVATAFSLIVTIAQSSVDRLLIRLWLRDASQARLTAQLATWISLLSTALGALACLSLGATGLSALVALYGTSIVGQMAYWAEENRYRAQGKLQASNRAKTFGEVAPAIGRAAGAVVTGSALGVCAGSAVGAVGLLLLGRRQLLALSIRRDRLWRASRELAVSSAIGAVSAAYWRIDLFILAIATDARAVASYAIAVRASELALILPSIYGQLSIADLVRGQRPARIALAQGRTLVRVSVVLSMIGVVASVPIAGLVEMTLDKPASAAVFALLALTLPPAFYGAVIGNVLYATKREAMLLRVLIMMLIGNVLLNLSLIPFFGAEGAAAATCLTESVGVAWLAWQMRSQTRRLTTVGAK